MPLAWIAAPRLASQLLARQSRGGTPAPGRPEAISPAALLGAIALVWILLPFLGLALPLLGDAQFARAWSDVARSGVDTLVYAAGAGAVAVALAVGLTAAVGREVRLHRVALAAAIVLVSLPPAFSALGIVELGSRAPAWADVFLRSRATVCVALGLRFFPVAAVLVLRAWGSTPRSWTMAAAVAGVPLRRYALRVLFPIFAPALAVAAILVGLLATADVGTVLLVHPPGHGSVPLSVFTIMANAPESRVASLCALYVSIAAAALAVTWQLVRRRDT